MSDLCREYFVTRLLNIEGSNTERLTALLDEVEAGALGQYASEGIAAHEVRLLRYGNLRYENQEHSVEIPLPAGTINGSAMAEIATAFHRAYEREYTYRLDSRVELVSVHLVAHAEVGKLELVPRPRTGRRLEETLKGRRQVDYATAGIHEAEVYTGELLEPGMSFAGPAIIESKGSTVVVHPGNQLSVDEYGNVIISIPPDGHEEAAR